MENNIFKYITKEMSHDAFICWMLNWINIPENSENKDIKKKKKKIIEQIVIESKNENFKNILKKDYKINIFKQFRKKVNSSEYVAIDVLVVIENEYVIIIEDKIDTGIHDDQIERYKKRINEII